MTDWTNRGELGGVFIDHPCSGSAAMWGTDWKGWQILRGLGPYASPATEWWMPPVQFLSAFRHARAEPPGVLFWSQSSYFWCEL